MGTEQAGRGFRKVDRANGMQANRGRCQMTRCYLHRSIAKLETIYQNSQADEFMFDFAPRTPSPQIKASGEITHCNYSQARTDFARLLSSDSPSRYGGSLGPVAQMTTVPQPFPQSEPPFVVIRQIPEGSQDLAVPSRIARITPMHGGDRKAPGKEAPKSFGFLGWAALIGVMGWIVYAMLGPTSHYGSAAQSSRNNSGGGGYTFSHDQHYVGGSGSSRNNYGGGGHTYSHGGHFVGGVGSSHRGGTYVSPSGGHNYGRHR